MVLFHKLFSIYSECSKKYEKDSHEYKKCKELKNINDQSFQEFLDKNQQLLEQYIEMLENFHNQQFLMQMNIMQKKIDDEIENYISFDEQMEFLKEFFEIKVLFENIDNEFNR
ncbi:MAG: hypothetical protein U9N59_15185 [Campylobacterota bacterium]|nr:hypothetical protein [Campylobacterota bacterium]